MAMNLLNGSLLFLFHLLFLFSFLLLLFLFLLLLLLFLLLGSLGFSLGVFRSFGVGLLGLGSLGHQRERSILSLLLSFLSFRIARAILDLSFGVQLMPLLGLSRLQRSHFLEVEWDVHILAITQFRLEDILVGLARIEFRFQVLVECLPIGIVNSEARSFNELDSDPCCLTDLAVLEEGHGAIRFED